MLIDKGAFPKGAKCIIVTGVPLHIETDYSQDDAEQIKTRVQVFLEIMN